MAVAFVPIASRRPAPASKAPASPAAAPIERGDGTPSGVDGLAGESGDGRARDEGLEAAVLAAGAAGAARVDDDVADLAGQAARSAMEPAVEDDAGRDAGPDREVGEVVDVADDATPMETEGGGADVVLDDARATEAVLELRTERQVRPAEVDREGDGAGQRVDPAGDADAEGRDVVGRGAGGGEGAPDDRGDLVDGAFRGAGRGGRDVAGQDVLVAIDDEDGDLAAADIDADEERAVAAVQAFGGRGSAPSARRSVIDAPSGRARG